MEASPNEAQPLRVAARDVIQCTEQELQLFEQVMSAVRENGLKTTVRVAGGWVRDKVQRRLQQAWMRATATNDCRLNDAVVVAVRGLCIGSCLASRTRTSTSRWTT